MSPHLLPRTLALGTVALFAFVATAPLAQAVLPDASTPPVGPAPAQDIRHTNTITTPVGAASPVVSFRPRLAEFEGSTVTYTNNDVTRHRPMGSVADNVPACFDTGEVLPGVTVTIDVSACPDEVVYHCQIHDGMLASLTRTIA